MVLPTLRDVPPDPTTSKIRFGRSVCSVQLSNELIQCRTVPRTSSSSCVRLPRRAGWSRSAHEVQRVFLEPQTIVCMAVLQHHGYEVCTHSAR
jgi:hypothetical protein